MLWNQNQLRKRPFWFVGFVFANTDRVTIPRRLELMLCSIKRPRACMKMSNFQRRYSPGYRHMTCIGKTKSTSGKLKVYCTHFKNPTDEQSLNSVIMKGRLQSIVVCSHLVMLI